MTTIGFIGGGNMAEALIKGVTAAGLYQSDDVFVSDIRNERLVHLSRKYGVCAVADNAELAEQVNIVVLAIKPQNMTEALESIRGKIQQDTLVISIAAGIRTANITKVLGDVPIVRVMPNTPALISEGASALFANEKAELKLDDAIAVFSAVGKSVVVDDEDLIDAVTAVSGSGPAYYFLLMEEMIKAAVQLGLREDVAKDLVLQTAKGAAMLAVEADEGGESPAQLRRKVTSAGGTTEAALKVLAEADFSLLVAKAIKRACDRGKELSM